MSTNFTHLCVIDGLFLAASPLKVVELYCKARVLS